MNLKCEKCDLIYALPDKFNPLAHRVECPNCGGNEFVTHSDTVICDFCCAPDETVVASYPARDFKMPVANVQAGMRGWWACCATCRSLIEADKRRELAERSADGYLAKGEAPIPRDVLVMSIYHLHSQFFANREGPVVNHGPLAPEQTGEFRT